MGEIGIGIGIRIGIGYLILWNAVTFLAYAVDKQRARRGAWRIPERTLLLLAAAGGSFGALLGMYLMHHKTKHLKFAIGVPMCLLIQMCVLLYFLLSSPSIRNS